MRASLAVLCLTVALVIPHAGEAQLRAVRYSGGDIIFKGVSGVEKPPEQVPASAAPNTDSSAEGRIAFSQLPTIITSFEAASLGLEQLLRPKVQLLPELRVSDPCKGVDTVIELQNNLLNPLTLASLQLSDSSHFAVSCTGLPVTIVPNETLRLHIHASGKVSGTFLSRLQFGIISQDQNYDTTITLGLAVESDLPFNPFIEASTFHVGPITACDSRQFNVLVTNPMCDTLKLTSARWFSAANSFSTLQTEDFPIAIPPGHSLEREMKFTPGMAGDISARLLLSFKYGGKVRDTTLNFTGTATSQFSAYLKAATLKFDTVLHCDFKQLTTYLFNRSCDSIRVEALESSPTAGFSLVGEFEPFWLAKDDSMPINVVLTPDKSGNVSDTINVKLRSREGEERSLSLKLNAFVKAAKHDVLLPTAMVLDSVKPCGTIDTAFYIINRGVCDTLFLKRVELTGSKWFMIDPTANGKALLPGESMRIPLTIAVEPEGAAEAKLRVSGVGFDSTIKLSVNVRGGGRVLQLVAADTIFRATLCQTATRTYYLRNSGCIDMPIDSFYIQGGSESQTQFRITSEFPKPFVVKAGDVVPVQIVFDADGNGDGDAVLSLRAHSVALVQDIHLLGAVLGHKAVARIGLLAGRGEQQATSAAGQTVAISVVALDDLPDTVSVTGLAFNLKFDQGILTHRSIDGVNGWTVAYANDSNGHLQMYFVHQGAAKLVAGSEIAKISFYTTISDSNYSHITLDQPRFNPEDPGFERCKLSALSADDTLRIDISMFSGDAVDHGMQPELSTIRGMAVYPNPVTSNPGKIAMAEVDFTLADEGSVKMLLRDDLGRLVSVLLQAHMYAGKHYIPIALPLSAEGNYFLSVESSGFRDVRKIIIRN
jgi:hypothetical protein